MNFSGPWENITKLDQYLFFQLSKTLSNLILPDQFSIPCPYPSLTGRHFTPKKLFNKLPDFSFQAFQKIWQTLLWDYKISVVPVNETFVPFWNLTWCSYLLFCLVFISIELIVLKCCFINSFIHLIQFQNSSFVFWKWITCPFYLFYWMFLMFASFLPIFWNTIEPID